MAIMRLNADVISAGKGGNAVAAGAYRHAATMSQRTSFSYEGKAAEVVHSEIAVPEALPEWADRRFGPSAYEAALAEQRAAAQGEEVSDDVLQRHGACHEGAECAMRKG